ncbi:glycosyltransferase [Vibrio aerogenes]|uniref:glycosyltransferase n=1 Tax=Vibrio aerogenes TaxID=92172 RepID=UPI0039EDF101
MKLLFIGEAVTLAHVARPWTLACFMAERGYDVHFASEDRFNFLFDNDTPVTRHHLPCRSHESFLEAVENCRPLFESETLIRYVEQETELLKRVKPDVVIGDFRHSLSVSCRVLSVPYVGLNNAYWSPYVVNSVLPVPEHKTIPFSKVGFLNRLMPAITPIVFKLMLSNLNKMRRHYSFSPYKTFREALTDSDLTLYYEPQGFIDMTPLPEHHRFIGSVSWAPKLPLPDFFSQLNPDKPLVYVSLGSSGVHEIEEKIVHDLKACGVNIVVNSRSSYPDVYHASLIPGDLAAEKADLVICNGGSPMAYLALSQGTPVLGIPANNDQLLVMKYVEAKQLGQVVRWREVKEGLLKSVVPDMLNNTRMKNTVKIMAGKLNPELAPYHFEQEMIRLMAQCSIDHHQNAV